MYGISNLLFIILAKNNLGPKNHMSAHFEQCSRVGDGAVVKQDPEEWSIRIWGETQNRSLLLLCKSLLSTLSLCILFVTDPEVGRVSLVSYLNGISACLAGGRAESTPEATGRP